MSRLHARVTRGWRKTVVKGSEGVVKRRGAEPDGEHLCGDARAHLIRRGERDHKRLEDARFECAIVQGNNKMGKEDGNSRAAGDGGFVGEHGLGGGGCRRV